MNNAFQKPKKKQIFFERDGKKLGPKPLQRVNRVPTMSHVRKDCYVGGALALILHISRLFGMAPLKMARELGRWRVSVSTAACLYSYVVILGLHVTLLTGVAMDISLDDENSGQVRTPISGIAWIMEMIILLSATTIGLFGAPARMKEMIECLNVIEKVYIKSIHVDWLSEPGEKKRYIGTIVYVLVVNCILFGDLYIFINASANEGRNVARIYSSFYIELFIMVILELQFLFIALHVTFALKFVNDSLSDIICIFDLSSAPKLSSFSLHGYNLYTTLSTAPVQILVENVKTNNKIKPDVPTITIKRAQEKVRTLMLSFGAICDVIRQINTNYEKILLLLIGSFFLHLVITPYFLVSFLFSQNDKLKDIILQVFYLIIHTSYLIVAVEPGHRTEQELQRTSILVSQLLRRVSSPRDCLGQELDLFFKQITLNKVSYSPLGICTMTRPLIAAMCGGVTTYLVIILQFQALERQNW